MTISLWKLLAPLSFGNRIADRALRCRSAGITAKSRGLSLAGMLRIGIVIVSLAAFAFPQTKRNDRPNNASNPLPEENTKPVDATRYTWEFMQPEFVVRHIKIEHDAAGHGQITFERKGEDTSIVEPVELSASALGRIFGLWKELNFLDSTENYQAAKNFAHLGTYKIGMDNGQRRRLAEFNWSNNKRAWSLVTEYRRVSDQAILIFDIKLAREMQPLNAPGLMNQMESYLNRGDLSDPNQLVPLLKELRTDEHIPLIARNHADRLLKKIEK